MRDPHETCLETENHLPLWAGGDLEPDVHASVEQHLERCESCARAALRARTSRAALREGLRQDALSMGVGRDPWPAIRGSLRAEGLVPGARPRALRRWNHAWPVAAAVLIGLFLAGTWDRGTPDPTTVTPTVRTAELPSPTPAEPVAAIPAGLRRLSPTDPRMRDTAWRFLPRAASDSPDAPELLRSEPVYQAAGSVNPVQLYPPPPPR